MELKKRCFSPARLKQLANFLVLILSANILLESFSSNLLLASPRNTRKFSQVLVLPATSLPASPYEAMQDRRLNSGLPGGASAKTGLVLVNTVGGACDPTVTNSCGNGLRCDPSAKTCLISVSNSCWNNPNSCAAGLNCDASTHLCCAPIGGSCLGEIDCCSNAICDPPSGGTITADTPGSCKIAPQSPCTQSPNACGAGTICGTSMLGTTQTCCAPANAPCSLAGDCCAGLVCDDTADLNQCVSCLAANHVCSGNTDSCCEPLVCDPSGLCVMPAMPNCPILGQQCASFGDCGGYNCNLICDQAMQNCQLCGGLGATCIGDPTCCSTALNGMLRCDLVNQTCCVPMGQNCTVDTDCCSDAAGEVQCLPGTSKNIGGFGISVDDSGDGINTGWNTGKICTLTEIFAGQLCGASFNSVVEITGNANTPCQQADPYGRPVSCNLVPAGSANLASNLCTVKLLPAGAPCTELTTMIAGVSVTYNYCDGWDGDQDQSEAACLINPLDPQQERVCCALAGGTCDPTHADNGNSDCCYSTLICDSTLNQCVYPNSNANFIFAANQAPDLQLHSLGASAQMDPYEAALIAVCMSLVLLLVWAGVKFYGSINKLLASLRQFVDLRSEDITTLKAVYPKNFAAKGCDPAKRQTFIDTLLEVMSTRLTKWSELVDQTGMTDLEFRTNLSTVAQLLIQQKLGEVLDLPGIEKGAALTIQNYFKDLLPEMLRTTLKSLGIPELFIETIVTRAQPLAERKFDGLMTKARTYLSAKMNSEAAVDPALTLRSLQAISALFKGVIKIVQANQAPDVPIPDLITKLTAAAVLLDQTITNMGPAAEIPASAAGGPLRDPASSSVLARAATANTIESLFASIELKLSQVMPNLRQIYPNGLNFISQAFNADPVDFAKLYVSVLAQVMLDNPGQPVSDAQMVAAMKSYSKDWIFNPGAKLSSSADVTFWSILTSGPVQQALIAAGGGAVDTAAIIPIFQSTDASMPLGLKQLILTIEGWPGAETITQAEINAIDYEALEIVLEVAVPLLNQVTIQDNNGETYPLMTLDGTTMYNDSAFYESLALAIGA